MANATQTALGRINLSTGTGYGGATDKYATYLQLFSGELFKGCLLYTSPSPRDGLLSRMPSSA